MYTVLLKVNLKNRESLYILQNWVSQKNVCKKDDVIGFLASHWLSYVVGEDTTRNIDSNPLASNDELESPYSQQMELYAVSPEICSLLEKNLSWTKYGN